jgi:hypothetical protein
MVKRPNEDGSHVDSGEGFWMPSEVVNGKQVTQNFSL